MKSQTVSRFMCVWIMFLWIFLLVKFIIRTLFCVRFSRFPSLKASKEIWLKKCQLYSVELLIKQSGGSDCASVGMKLPNGTYKGPITAAHLFWVKPGKQWIACSWCYWTTTPFVGVKFFYVSTCFLTNCFSQAETPWTFTFRFLSLPFVFVFSLPDFPFVGHALLASF